MLCRSPRRLASLSPPSLMALFGGMLGLGFFLLLHFGAVGES